MPYDVGDIWKTRFLAPTFVANIDVLRKLEKSNFISTALLVWIFYTEAIFLSAERGMAAILTFEYNKRYAISVSVLFVRLN